MKNGFLFILLVATNIAVSQSITLMIKLVDTNNRLLVGEKVSLIKLNLGDTTLFYSDSKGNTAISLERDLTYLFQFRDPSKNFTLKTDAMSRVLLTRKIILTAKPIIENLVMDTVFYSDELGESPRNMGIIDIKLINTIKKEVKDVSVWLICTETAKVYGAKTNELGHAKFHIPRGLNCEIYVNRMNFYRSVTCPVTRGMHMRETYIYQPLLLSETMKGDTIFQDVSIEAKPTSEYVLLVIQVNDLNGDPLEKEQVTLKPSLDTGKIYFAKTGAYGGVRFLVKKGDNYTLSFKYDPKIDVLKYKNAKGYITTDIEYQSIGSKRVEIRMREREKMLAERDALYALSGGHNLLSIKSIQAKAKEISALASDDKKMDSFKKERNTVCAVLLRNKHWKDKGIVTDITGSMSPYYFQVILWHALELTADPEVSYTFFNDGDSKIMKEIGSTGGIYHSKGNLNQMVKTVKLGTSRGNGGDGPENDVEALITELQKKNPRNLILIADNYSSVRDIELLIKIGITVKVIICGASDMPIHEDYLRLAYKTGGSIHTIEEDIKSLKSVVAGKKLTIGGFNYRFLKGRFILEK